MEELNTVGVEAAGYEIQVYDAEDFPVQAENAVGVYLNAARIDYVVDLVDHRFESLTTLTHSDGTPKVKILCHCEVSVTVYTSDLLEGEILLEVAYKKFAEHQVAQFGGMI